MDDGLPHLGKVAEQASASEEVWLLGQPTLGDYLSFVRNMVVGDGDPREHCDAWRRANDHYYDLEECEPGIAEQFDCRELDSAHMPLAEEVMASPRFRRCFDTLPTRIQMVELDKLVVFQRHVARPFVDALKRRLPPRPTPDDLFRFALPLGVPDAPVHMQRVNRRRYIFSSDSTDFRFQEAALLGGDQLNGYVGYGPVGGIVGLFVGFGSNFLNAISADNRLLLHNGYHRACALRELGITHAPCIVQEVTRTGELAICASSWVTERPAFYFRSKRPPLLKDFDDPMIRRVLPVRRFRKVVEVNFEVREFQLPE
jgi:hypothetical protein